MVAETHSTFEDLNRSDILDFVLGELLDVPQSEPEAGRRLLSSFGLDDLLEVAKLAELIGEEYGERTLVGAVLDEVDETWSVADLVTALYPDLAD